MCIKRQNAQNLYNETNASSRVRWIVHRFKCEGRNDKPIIRSICVIAIACRKIKQTTKKKTHSNSKWQCPSISIVELCCVTMILGRFYDGIFSVWPLSNVIFYNMCLFAFVHTQANAIKSNAINYVATSPIFRRSGSFNSSWGGLLFCIASTMAKFKFQSTFATLCIIFSHSHNEWVCLRVSYNVQNWFRKHVRLISMDLILVSLSNQLLCTHIYIPHNSIYSLFLSAIGGSVTLCLFAFDLPRKTQLLHSSIICISEMKRKRNDDGIKRLKPFCVYDFRWERVCMLLLLLMMLCCC